METGTQIDEGVTLDTLLKMDVLDDVAHAKLIPEENPEQFTALERKISDAIRALPR